MVVGCVGGVVVLLTEVMGIVGLVQSRVDWHTNPPAPALPGDSNPFSMAFFTFVQYFFVALFLFFFRHIHNTKRSNHPKPGGDIMPRTRTKRPSGVPKRKRSRQRNWSLKQVETLVPPAGEQPEQGLQGERKQGADHTLLQKEKEERIQWIMII